MADVAYRTRGRREGARWDWGGEREVLFGNRTAVVSNHRKIQVVTRYKYNAPSSVMTVDTTTTVFREFTRNTSGAIHGRKTCCSHFATSAAAIERQEQSLHTLFLVPHASIQRRTRTDTTVRYRAPFCKRNPTVFNLACLYACIDESSPLQIRTLYRRSFVCNQTTSAKAFIESDFLFDQKTIKQF